MKNASTTSATGRSSRAALADGFDAGAGAGVAVVAGDAGADAAGGALKLTSACFSKA